jgi:hypothetical protein
MSKDKSFWMDENQSLSPLGPNYQSIKFDTISEVVLFTQRNKAKIKKEHKKLKNFYKENPEAFFYSLKDTKQKLESKDSLTDFDKIELEEINKMLENYEDIDSIFSFNNDYLLENFQKIYIQLSKLDRDLVKNSSVIEVYFYSLTDKSITEVPVGEFFDDGTINSGSLLRMEVVKINPMTFIYLYQTLLN